MAGVVQDADRALVAALADRFCEVHVEIALTDHEDFLPLLVPLGGHAVEVEEVQVRQHRRKGLRKPRQVVVAVVLVVDDAHVRHLQFLADGDHVLRLTAPAAVVVDRHAAAGLRRSLGDRTDPVGRMLHLRLLVEFAWRPGHHPKRRLQAALLKALQQSRKIRRH